MIRKISRLLFLVAFLLLPLVFGNRTGPVHGAPPYLPRGDRISHASAKAYNATCFFWEVFHGNDYTLVDDAIARLTEAYSEDPNDPAVAILLGLGHFWKFHEHGRCGLCAADVHGHLVMGIQICQRALQLDPHNRIVPSFIQTGKATLGVLEGNQALVEEGLEGLRRNTRNDPATHGVVQGFVFSALLSEHDKRYREAYKGFFATMDTCAAFRVPRNIPRVGPAIYSWIALRARRDSVCYNSDVAPHNMEASLLALGDAYLKHGKTDQAGMAYKSVKRCPSYPTWPYQEQLETRLANLKAVKDQFRAQTANLDAPDPAMYFLSTFTCTGCHAR